MEAVAGELKLLDDTRELLRLRLKSETSAFRLSHLRQIESSLQKLEIAIRNEIGHASKPLPTQPSSGITGVSRPLLKATAGFTAPLLSELRHDQQALILFAIKHCALGAIGIQDAVRSAGAILGDAAQGEGIVRTEVLRLYSVAAFARLSESAISCLKRGYVLKKKWLSAGDRRVRPSHAAAHGQIRDITEAFDVGGEKLMFPHDPNGSRENTFLCRCALSSELYPKLES